MKRTLTLILRALLITSLLAACLPVAPGIGASELAEPKPVLKLLTNNASMTITPDELAKLVKEHTGYDIEHTMLPVDNPVDTLMLDLATGVDYDIIVTDYNKYQTALASGALMKLNDLIDQYGPNLKEVISQETWDMFAQNGDEYYGIPARAPMSRINDGMAVRKDILDQIGGSIPTNLDEYYEMLKLVKEQTDMIPLVINPSLNYIAIIGSAFGISTDYVDEGGQLVPRIMSAPYLDYLKFMNKLYNEGLLDSEMPVTKYETFVEKVTSGQAFAFHYSWGDAPTFRDPLYANVEGAEIVQVHPLLDAEGKMHIQASGRQFEEAAYVPKTSKNAAYVVDYSNTYLEADVFKALTIGVEGVHHTFEDGAYYPILPAFNEFNNTNLIRAGVREDDFVLYWQGRVRKAVSMADCFFEMIKDIDQAEVSPVLYATRPVNAKYTAALSTLITDSTTAIIAGKPEDVEAAYQKMCDDWLGQGGQEVLDEANAYYAANK